MKLFILVLLFLTACSSGQLSKEAKDEQDRDLVRKKQFSHSKF